ncbi:MAG TPA: helix-turn-helix transcriptional regulator [Actinophytocola sp.]|uniref:helix-turn-helix domain-containing protein n=1 Tax=Actinophytocola sp. TaxID=1872138 RepID=UPI002DDCC318|nr:helix-turn-helix transcriptional regulator [Actinophytocola sp.]HEV2779126.1 helix-turn-helix transcriptional regulator [Actinophytocola sp.]
MATSAVVAAWELGLRLRERRDQLDLSVAAAAKAVKMQQSNLSAVESGKKKITASNLSKLAKLYEFEPGETEELEALRVGADQRDWYHEYTWLLDEDFIRYLGLETGAKHLRTYQNSIVPGPLQTTDYTLALIRGAPYVRLTELEPRLKVRQTRQRRLVGDEPLHVFALLSEAVLRQEIGGRQVLLGQLEQLVRLATDRDNIEIRVIPFGAGAHAALGSPFQTLSFASPRLPDVLWLEALTAYSIIEHPVQVHEFVVAFAEANANALDTESSVDFIRQIIEELT